MLLSKLALGTLLSLASASAFAGTCDFPDYTSDLKSLDGFQSLGTINPLEAGTELTASETEMIQAAVQSNSNEGPITDDQALADFNDGYSSGSIDYFTLDGTVFAVVTYFPGDNEYGVLVQLDTLSNAASDFREASFEVVANVQDGEIECLN